MVREEAFGGLSGFERGDIGGVGMREIYGGFSINLGRIESGLWALLPSLSVVHG